MSESSPVRNFRDRLQTLWRGLTIIQRMEPALLPVTVVWDAFKALSPFVNIIMMSMIIDELLGARSLQRLLLWAAIALGSNLLVGAATRGLERWRNVLNRRLYFWAKIEADRLILKTDFENVESPAFHLKKQKIDEACEMGNRGMWSIARLLDIFLTSLFAVLFSTVIALPVFLQTSSGGAGRSIFSSPWFSIGFLLLILLSCYASVLINTKFSAMIFQQMDYTLPQGRKFFFYSGIISDVRFGKDIRIYRIRNLITWHFNQFIERAARFYSDVGKMQGLFFAVNATLSALLGGTAYLFVGLKALAGLITIGSVVKYVGAINQFITALSNVVSSAADNLLNTDYVKIYLDFLDTPDLKYRGTLPVEKRNDNEYEIEFRNVSFKYPASDSYALHNFSLKLRVGQRLAVVGMNGSGKTTCVKLLCRLYDPQEGEILLNGINIKKYDYREYLSLFSVVFQDFTLFAFSAGQNVGAAVDYEREKALDCLDKAGAGDFIRRLPRGVDTPVYKIDREGVDISGGEAQKIALARALYKDAPFIVLDEPTAALDPIAEFDIYSRFNEIAGAKTAIFISHRLSSCRFCDEIAVFDKGQMVERGTHAELIEDQSSKYYQLWNAQAQYYRAKA